MSGYGWAWLIIGAAGLIGWLALVRLTRPLGASPVRWLLQALVLLWLLLPAPVPGHAGQWAPAFIVLIFESVFQRGGEPLPAALILLFGSLVALLLVMVLALRRRRDADGEGSARAVPARDGEPPPGPAHRKVADPN